MQETEGRSDSAAFSSERMTSENVAGFATCELTKEDPQVAHHYQSDKAFEPSHIFTRNSELDAAEL